ncbi:hypothetical protein HG537_0H00200 [Torulaspora globosa]|uniref:Reverse transcriptase Ty1/copia-type domain-containing protein n=1 Tax=Torulaspora globosa TaxID=48254 RepID=A0A7H9HX00_9SACH|nr:hypothetical protein HG537_0H00200 [Torulaspora sp. CBS 2947]
MKPARPKIQPVTEAQSNLQGQAKSRPELSAPKLASKTKEDTPESSTDSSSSDTSPESDANYEPDPHSDSDPSDSASGGTNPPTQDSSQKTGLLKRRREDLVGNENQDDSSSQNEPPTTKQRVRYAKVTKQNTNSHAERPSLSYKEPISMNSNADEKEKFIAAYDKEISQLIKMSTWDQEHIIEADSVLKSRIVNSTFIFTTKRDGNKKCRFVARGDQQKTETYLDNLQANTVHNCALMTCMEIALDNDLHITQLDISSAYLYADLEEELYIRAPPHMNMKNKVLRLRKSLYGLKQSGANWYKTLRRSYETKVVNIGTPDEDGIVNYDILGLEVEYKVGEYLKFGMNKSLTDKLPQLGIPLTDNCRMNKVPGQPGMFRSKEDLVMDKNEYERQVLWMQKVIGLASYVAQKYRYDILYYVNVLAQHTLFPSKQVRQLTHQLIQFLWNTREKQLLWHKHKIESTNVLSAITDASFAGQREFKSQGGYLIRLNGNIIGGKSSKIKLTCTSSTEAEIYGITGAIPILRDLQELVKSVTNSDPDVVIITDSQPTIALMKSDDDKKFRNKFFGARSRRLRDEVADMGLSVEYVRTKDNLADLLTKPLPVKQFLELAKRFIQ